jgi:hypothetical protein
MLRLLAAVCSADMRRVWPDWPSPQVNEQFSSLELRLLKYACRYAKFESLFNPGSRVSLSFVQRMPIFERFQLNFIQIQGFTT